MAGKRPRIPVQDILDHTVDAVFVFDGEGRVRFANRQASRSLGVTPKELLSLSLSDFASDRLPSILQPTLERVRREEQVSLRGRHRRRDGTSFPVDVRVSRLSHGPGQADLFVAVARDVTEQVAAEEALRRSEERFRSVLQSSPMGIHLYDLAEDGHLVFAGANPAADRILGVDHRGFLGRTLEELFPPLAGTEIPGIYRRIASDGGSWHSQQVDYRDERVHGAFEVFAYQTAPGAVAAAFQDVTARIREREALLFRDHALRTSFTGVAMADPSGTLTYVNDALVRMWGYERDSEMVGRSALEFWSRPEDAAEVISAVVREGHSSGEIEAVRGDGSRFLARLAAGMVRDAQGRPMGLFGWFTDVTRERAVEEALRRSEAEKDTILGTLSELVVYQSPDMEILWANRAAGDSVGVQPADLVGRKCYEVWHQRTTPCVVCPVVRARESGRPEADHVRSPDGRAWFIRGYPVKDAGGRITALIEVTREETAEVKAKEALEESEERFRRAFDASPDALVILDVDTRRIMDVNRGFVESSGFRHEEVVGRESSELGLWEDLKARDLLYRLIGERGRADHLEAAFRTRDGTVKHGLVSAVPLTLRGAAHLMVIVRDISPLKEADERLRGSLLEKEVLLKEIHHRVKNNLQAVSGMLNLQAHHLADPVTRQVFKESQNRVITMALIHEELYRAHDLARLDFAAYLRSLVENLLVSYGAASRVGLELEAEATAVVVDTAIPCGLIANELISNSLKHAFGGGRRGRLRVEFGTAGPGWYRLAVADDGPGLPAGFDVKGGRTLGLKLVTVMVDQLGGSLEVGRGPGARFDVRFPEYHEAGTRLD